MLRHATGFDGAGHILDVHSKFALRAKFHYAIQLATSWLAGSRSATSSQAHRRPASEQVSVMEYGLNRSATRFELSPHVEIHVARTCLRQVGNQFCDLDSVMEFSLKQVADQLANQLASWSWFASWCAIC